MGHKTIEKSKDMIIIRARIEVTFVGKRRAVIRSGHMEELQGS